MNIKLSNIHICESKRKHSKIRGDSLTFDLGGKSSTHELIKTCYEWIINELISSNFLSS